MEEPSSEPKESHPANLVSLRTAAASLRDQIHRIEKEEQVKGTLNSRKSSSSLSQATVSQSNPANLKATEKHRKKLAEVEAQLVLASPTLVFQVGCDFIDLSNLDVNWWATSSIVYYNIGNRLFFETLQILGFFDRKYIGLGGLEDRFTISAG